MRLPRPVNTAPPNPFTRPVSRRGVLAGALALSATGVLGACTSEQAPEAPGSAADVPEGPWSFTDDTGETVELDAVPTRIAGLTDQIAALWNLGIVPIASFGYTALADDVAFEGKPIEQVEEVGTAYGEIDLEALAGAAPELIVTTVYPTETGGEIGDDVLLYGFKDEDQLAQVREIAPVVAIAQAGSAKDVIERNVQLAESLGVDVDSGPVADARAEFEAAGEALSQAARSGISVLAVVAYPAEGMYVAKARDDPALRYYTELGVSDPDVGGGQYYWDVVAWENADTYRADLVLNSLRAMTIRQLSEQPTFERLPAAVAGQVHDWKFQSMDYTGQAPYMRELARWLDSAHDVT